MKLQSVGWLLLLIFTDSGLVKHMGEYDNKSDCIAAWNEMKECFAKLADKDKRSGKECWIYCGEPIGWCIEAERLTMPGVIFPLPKKEATCD